MDVVQRIIHRFRVPYRIASKYFEERYAKLLLAMSYEEAKGVLGLTDNFTPADVQKAYRQQAFANHPDRGGDNATMIKINVAKDILEGKTKPDRSSPSSPSPSSWSAGPYKRDPRDSIPWDKDPETVYMKGETFEHAMSTSGIPAGVDWKFVSIPEWAYEEVYYPGHRVWVLYGQTDQKHVFLALKERGESMGVIDTDLGHKTHIEQDWQSSEVDVPISENISKIAARMIKEIGTSWLEKIKPKAPRKFVAWPGGKPTEQLLHKIPRSGGAALKDILVGTGLLNEDDPSVAGRKSVVELYTKMNREKGKKNEENARAQKREDPSKKVYTYASSYYDFFIRINGKTEQLTDETVLKMNKKFIPWIMNNQISEGAAFNVTRLRGGRMKFPASVALRELSDCMTGEPSWVIIALERAAEEWEPESKTAEFLRVRSEMTLHQAAEALDMEPFELFGVLHG